MKLLAMLHSPAPSGADTTIRRIAAHLRDSGHTVMLTPGPEDPDELARLAKKHGVDMLVGTHALFSGAPFLAAGLPYVLVLGGTDLNAFTLDPDSLAVMTEAVDRAAALVAFNDDFVQRCSRLWPRSAEKVHLIPQGVSTAPSQFSLRAVADIPDDAVTLLLPSGLRPVKDPLLLVDCVRRWHADDPRIRLVISGLSYDEDFEGIVRRRCGPGPAVQYVGALERDDLHAAMREATAVLNTSLSECSPNTVLEAMELRRPVVVRDIPGNTCLVEHGVTGLVFTGPDDFREQVQRLLDEDGLAAEIGQRGQTSVRRSHSLPTERAAYAAVFRDLLDVLPPDVDAASRDRRIAVRGVDLYVQTFGDRRDPAVLLIAGASASMLSWETEFCERLAAGSRFVIRYDHRDTGRSVRYRPGEPPYNLRDLAADAAALLGSLGLARAHVVGISLGGMIAQLLALDHPERTASLTLISSSPGEPGPEAAEDAELPPPDLDVLVELDDLGEPDWQDRDAVIDHLVASARAQAGRSRGFDEASARRLAGRIFDRAPQALPAAANHILLDRGRPWRPRLAGISVPTLVIHGAEDPIHPLAHAYALAAEIPDTSLRVLERAGHGLARADWEDVTEAVRRHTDPTEKWSDSATL